MEHVTHDAIAIVCWRPYQVFNALRLIFENAITPSTTCNYDLYLEGIPSLIMIEAGLKKSGVFRKIYYFEDMHADDPSKYCTITKRIVLWCKLILEAIFCKKYIKKRIIQKNRYFDAQYGIIMSSGWLDYFVYMANAHPSAIVYMYEDGLGTYFGDERIRFSSFLSKKKCIFYKILGIFFCKGPFRVSVSRIYINHPNLLQLTFPYEVRQMPLIEENTLSKLEEIFDYHKPEIYSNEKKIIFLSQNTKSVGSVAEFNDFKMCTPLERIKDKVIIRPHPRYPFSPQGFDVDTSEVSWELLASDIDNYILISNNSAAMFTPNMLYDNKNFTLIFLYKIMNKDTTALSNLDKFIISFKERINPNIFVPETFEEYTELIKKLVP